MKELKMKLRSLENTSNPLEEWKDILNWEGLYAISNLGRVYTYKQNKLRTLNPNSLGYIRITLRSKDRLAQPAVHRLVAQHFIPSDIDTERIEVNHINGIKTDNRAVNLEWCTRLENIHHSWDIGLRENLKGELNSTSKLTSKYIKAIRAMEGILTEREIAALFNIARSTTHSILSRGSWAHIE